MVAVVDALSRERPSSCKRGSIGVHGQGNAPIRAGSTRGHHGVAVAACPNRATEEPTLAATRRLTQERGGGSNSFSHLY